MRNVVAGGLSLIMVALVGSASAGPKWEYGDDSWMTVGFLGQVHYRYSSDQLPEGDVYLRRARLIMAGQITEGVKAFVETDNDNEGKAGTQNVSMDIQDAFVDFQIMGSDHWVEAGLILLPFSFETKSSAASSAALASSKFSKLSALSAALALSAASALALSAALGSSAASSLFAALSSCAALLL